MTTIQHHRPIDVKDLEFRVTVAIQEAQTAIQTYIADYTNATRGIAALEALGITQASPHYRDGKYLYLVHPTQEDGTRQREYIGSDPDKQREALARLERFTKHQQLTQQANDLAARINQAYSKIKSAGRSGGWYESL